MRALQSQRTLAQELTQACFRIFIFYRKGCLMGINASTIQKLYIAYFNRPADVAGLTYWEGQLDTNKISLAGLAQSFSEQVEYVATYGGKSTADVVTSLYKNLFGRAPDAAGLTYWATQIDTRAVNLGTAALAILNGATPDSLDGITIQNKLNFSANFTASLNTVEKANLYSSAYTFELMRSILLTVTGTGPLPALKPIAAVKIAAVSNGINMLEKAAGMDVLVDLTGMQAATGFQIELMNGDSPFTIPITHVLTMDEVITHKAVIHIPGGANLGPDGLKNIGVRVSDIFGNTGKAGGQLYVLLDTTPPISPANATYETWWVSTGGGYVDFVLGDIRYAILPGQMTGGSATLLDNGTAIGKITSIGSKDTVLDFVIDPKIGKQVYNDHFKDKNLTLVLTDAAGNVTTSKIDYSIPAVYKYKDGTPASNINIYADGNGLTVKASINGMEYLNSKAYLKINGQVVAVDSSVNANDISVDFSLSSLASQQLRNLVNAGGVVSVTMVDMNGKLVDSINSATLGPNQFGSKATLNSILDTPALPTRGKLFTTTDAGYVGMSEIQFSMISGQNTGGSAALMENGTVIAKITNIGANDTMLDFIFDQPLGRRVYDDYFTNRNLSLALTSSSGNTVISKFSDYQIYMDLVSKEGTPATNISLKPVGGNIVANSLNNSNTNLLVSATINGYLYASCRAYLEINGQIVAKDDYILSYDTTVDFDLATTNNVDLQSIVRNGGSVSVVMIDMNGKVVESSSNPYLVTNFTSAFASHDTKLATLAETPEHISLAIIGQPKQMQHIDMAMN
ncbi:DUF4214 domain-containing protein [Undibacterium sp. Tian12W]|uniref:DUF4214 domain-containing protein n=1 Tax=Undibacterium sp. Tian12W TaxID=3413054 RepID=UPI003BF00AC1